MSYIVKRISDNATADFVSIEMDGPNTAAQVVEVLSRPNVDGNAFRVMAQKGVPYRVRGTRNFKNSYAARTSIDVLRRNIKGMLVEIETNAQFFTRLMVLDVREIAALSSRGVANGLTIATGGLWGSAIGTSTVPGIGIVELIVVHVGDEPPP